MKQSRSPRSAGGPNDLQEYEQLIINFMTCARRLLRKGFRFLTLFSQLSVCCALIAAVMNFNPSVFGLATGRLAFALRARSAERQTQFTASYVPIMAKRRASEGLKAIQPAQPAHLRNISDGYSYRVQTAGSDAKGGFSPGWSVIKP